MVDTMLLGGVEDPFSFSCGAFLHTMVQLLHTSSDESTINSSPDSVFGFMKG